MLQELQKGKSDLKIKSEENKEKRNKLNAQASELASKRNELNKRTKELIDEAQEIKILRDINNASARENKAKRDEYNEKANKVYAKIDKIRKDLNLSDGPSLKEMRREIDHLEFKQQTEVMNSNKERELVERIGHLTEEFKRKKTQLEGNQELKDLLEEAQINRDQASEYHNVVKQFADAAQEYHENMIKIFKEADKVRAESDNIHKQFVEIQESAEVGLIFAGLGPITGSIWAEAAWGHYWPPGDIRLNTSLVIFFIYLAYLLIRQAIDGPEKKARLCAVFGIIGFISVPISFFSISL